MPRFFFHARLGDHVLPDEEGAEVSGAHDLLRVVAEAVRESALILSDAWTLEIADESGKIIMRVPISDVRVLH